MIKPETINELCFSLTSRVMVEGQGLVGGSVLKVDQLVEAYNALFRITKVKGYEYSKYNYRVEFVKRVATTPIRRHF